MLKYHCQWVLEQKKTDKQGSQSQQKLLHLKLIRGVRGFPLAYVVWNHTNVASRYGAYLYLEKEMIDRASIVDKRLNFKLSQDCLDRDYFDYQCDTFNIDFLGLSNLLKGIHRHGCTC